MNDVVIISAALAAITALVWWFYRSRENDRFDVFMQPVPATGIRSRAQWIDGANHVRVALSLQSEKISYQNSDVDGSIDLRDVDEVEYGSDLMTGGIANGAVLRLRSHGRAIEFVMDVASADQWSQHLPPHRMNESGRVQAI